MINLECKILLFFNIDSLRTQYDKFGNQIDFPHMGMNRINPTNVKVSFENPYKIYNNVEKFYISNEKRKKLQSASTSKRNKLKVHK